MTPRRVKLLLRAERKRLKKEQIKRIDYIVARELDIYTREIFPMFCEAKRRFGNLINR